MIGFSARRDTFDGQAIAVLADGVGQRASIALHGAVLLGYAMQRAGRLFDVAAGYRSGAEILARKGSYFAILAPFGGRVRDARYAFEGVEHDLTPGASGIERNARHGFVRDRAFDLIDLSSDDSSARATLATTIAPEPGYPFSIALELTFSLDQRGLDLNVGMRNLGTQAAPCFFGWHAYFRVGESRLDEWKLTIPARRTVRTDGELLALAGEAAYADLAAHRELDFRCGQRIGARVLDTSYLDLAPAPDGRLYSSLIDRSDGFGIEVWQERGVMHAFTGDTLGERARMALALEPMECMADAFNRSEWLQAIRLEPGTSRGFRCGVRRARA